METESGAKIAIRGKGSVKEGKGRSDAAHTSNQEEDLHCLIMADTEEKVNKAKKLIAQVIEVVCRIHHKFKYGSTNCCQAASIPEGQNELKRNQLRELAALNGTLRDDENQACQNCGQIGHRKYDCPEQRNFTANIICRVCGNAGHMARDCTERPRGSDWRNAGPPGAPGGPPGRPAAGRISGGDAVDREYEQLMQELSGGAAAGAGPQQRIEGGSGGYDSSAQGGSAAPWAARGAAPTGGPAPWRNRDDRDGASTGGPAPWANRGGRDNNNDSYGGGGYNGQGGNYGQHQQQGGAAPWRQGGSQANAPAAATAQPDAAAAAAAYANYDWAAYYAAAAAAGYTMPTQTGYPNAATAPPPPAGDAPPPPVSFISRSFRSQD